MTNHDLQTAFTPHLNQGMMKELRKWKLTYFKELKLKDGLLLLVSFKNNFHIIIVSTDAGDSKSVDSFNHKLRSSRSHDYMDIKGLLKRLFRGFSGAWKSNHSQPLKQSCESSWLT